MPRLKYKHVIDINGIALAIHPDDSFKMKQVGFAMGCVKSANDTEEFWRAYLTKDVNAVIPSRCETISLTSTDMLERFSAVDTDYLPSTWST